MGRRCGGEREGGGVGGGVGRGGTKRRKEDNANLPAAAMCSLVLIGWNPTKGTCIDMMSPMIKKVVYAKNIEIN